MVFYCNNCYRITPLGLVEISHALGLHSVPTQLLRCKAGANAIREAIAKGMLLIIDFLFREFLFIIKNRRNHCTQAVTGRVQ